MKAETANLFVEAGAEIDGSYRYQLWRAWGPGAGVLWIMLNPSTADATQLDPTLRRVAAFTEAWGFHRFVVANLFAWRATQPDDMMAADEPVGPLNDERILWLAQRAELVVAGWGNDGAYRGRAEYITLMLARHRIPLYRLATTQEGQPQHPLYLKADLRPFLLEEGAADGD